VHLQTVCVRHRPAGVDDETRLREHNLRIAEAINGAGRAYITPALLKGRQMLRLSIGAERTERQHVEALWTELQAAARDAADRA
jgi:aromatic-L-amino-acid decarboxylase